MLAPRILKDIDGTAVLRRDLLAKLYSNGLWAREGQRHIDTIEDHPVNKIIK